MSAFAGIERLASMIPQFLGCTFANHALSRGSALIRAKAGTVVTCENHAAYFTADRSPVFGAIASRGFRSAKQFSMFPGSFFRR
jgi:hypothetical protein